MAFDAHGLLPTKKKEGGSSSSFSSSFLSFTSSSSKAGSKIQEGQERVVIIQAKARGPSSVKLWKKKKAKASTTAAAAAAAAASSSKAYASSNNNSYPRSREERAKVLSVLNHHPYFRGLTSQKEKEEALKLFFPIRVKKGNYLPTYLWSVYPPTYIHTYIPRGGHSEARRTRGQLLRPR